MMMLDAGRKKDLSQIAGVNGSLDVATIFVAFGLEDSRDPERPCRVAEASVQE